MKTTLRVLLYAVFLLVFGVVSAFAQAVDCPALFREAIAAAAENCSGLERNQACIASGSVSMTQTADHTGMAFAQVGDRVDAAAIGSMTQTGGDAWALTVMRLQLNQPDAVTDHNSVVMLLGDLTLTQEAVGAETYTDAAIADLSAQEGEMFEDDGVPSPMQAFSVVSGEDHPCASALPQGAIVQSPNLTPADAGYMPTVLQVNGWRFGLGSTVLVNGGAAGETAVEVLEHYASVGGSDGEVVVLVGQGVDLPAGTPSVSNEDGTLVVVPRESTLAADAQDTGLLEGLIDELFGEEEVVNRRPHWNSQSGSTEPVNTQTNGQIMPDGIWKFEVTNEITRGSCMFNIWEGMIGVSEFVTLNEIVQIDSQGHPVAMSLFNMPYEFTERSSVVVDGQTMPGSDGRYEGFATPLGDTVFEWVRLDVITPFYMQGRFLGQVSDPHANRGCVHVFTFEIASCLQDLFYDETNGEGTCPAEIHQAMGTN